MAARPAMRWSRAHRRRGERAQAHQLAGAVAQARHDHCAGELADLRALAETAASAQELLTAVTARFADFDQEHREWWQLSAELWLYAQRHPEAAARIAAVQAETRQVIAQALGHGGQPVSGEVAAVVHALWSGFMHYRLISPDVVSADTFGRAVGWLLAGHQHDTKGARP